MLRSEVGLYSRGSGTRLGGGLEYVVCERYGDYAHDGEDEEREKLPLKLLVRVDIRAKE